LILNDVPTDRAFIPSKPIRQVKLLKIKSLTAALVTDPVFSTIIEEINVSDA